MLQWITGDVNDEWLAFSISLYINNFLFPTLQMRIKTLFPGQSDWLMDEGEDRRSRNIGEKNTGR